MHLLRRADPPSSVQNDVLADLGGAQSVPSKKAATTWTQESSLELWATKYPPTSEATIVVAKKKLDVLREWLKAWEVEQPSAGGGNANYKSVNPRKVLLLVGPPGSGKSAAVRFIVSEAKRKVHEWHAPVPTLWEEHKHLNNSGFTNSGKYMSKLDDFAAFVQCASRYAPLNFTQSFSTSNASSFQSEQLKGTEGAGGASTASNHKSTSPPILLVEDLPTGGSDDNVKRICELLQRLCRESRVPAVVMVSEEDAGGVGGLGGGAWAGGGGAGGGGADPSTSNTFGNRLNARRIVSIMEQSGAEVVAFNPATTPKLVKALSYVANAENVDVSDDRLHAIAVAAEGDVRCALASLQMFAAGRTSTVVAGTNDKTSKGKGKKRGRGENVEKTEKNSAENKTQIGDKNAADGARRDRGLSMFHALGKILYNKRDEEDTSTTGDKSTASGGLNGAGRSVAGIESDNALSGTSNASPFSSGKPTRDSDGTLRFGSCAAPFSLHSTFTRGSTKYDPEDILQRARFGADRATTFLFENFPEGLRDDAVFDLAVGTEYLSDAAWFASAGRRLASVGFMFSGASGDTNQTLVDGEGAPTDPGAVGELVAGSIATRGLLFAPDPKRPSLRGFRAFKGPNSAKAQRAAAANLREVRAVVAAAAGGDFSVGSDHAAAAAETLPMLRVIAGCGVEGAARVPYLPTRWVRVGEDPATAGGVGGLAPGVRCAPRPNTQAAEVVHRDAGAADTLEEEDAIEDEIEEW